MPEISRSQTLRSNERMKHLTSAFSAWGNALVIGGFGTMAAQQKFRTGAFLGILFGNAMLWISFVMLTMLMAEGEI